MSTSPPPGAADQAGQPPLPDREAVATRRARRYWDRRAGGYDKTMARMERLLLADGRQWVCAQATGEVLEVAIGTGRNLGFYPIGVRLTGLDYSPAMLAIARQRAHALGLQVDLREGDAHALPFADASFDTVVCTLGLCSVHDDRRVVAELVRVLRPGGLLLLSTTSVAPPGPCGRCSGCWSLAPAGSRSTSCAARWTTS
jgi:ubiquinone/menaquinone biosynthesis C-methylase UbiE